MKFEFNCPVVSGDKMFENVDGRTDDGTGGIGILIAHLGAFTQVSQKQWKKLLLFLSILDIKTGNGGENY